MSAEQRLPILSEPPCEDLLLDGAFQRMLSRTHLYGNSRTVFCAALGLIPCNVPSGRLARTRWSGFAHFPSCRWLTCATLQNLGSTFPLARPSRASAIHLKIMASCLVAASSYVHRPSARRGLGRIGVLSLGFPPSCDGILFSPTTIWASHALADSALLGRLGGWSSRIAADGSAVRSTSYRGGARSSYPVMLTHSPTQVQLPVFWTEDERNMHD